MVPVYKQIVPDPRPMSNLRVADFLDTSTFCNCLLVWPYDPKHLNISKVPVTIISKHPEHHMHFFRMTLPSESSKRDNKVFSIVFEFNGESAVILAFL